MSVFKDAKGREWEVVVSVDTVKRVRSLLGVDLLTVVEKDSPTMARLLLDPILLGDVLFVTVKPEADRRGIADTDFGEGLYRDALDAALKAFMEALADFFRGPMERMALKEIVARVFKMESRAASDAKAKIDAGELDKAMDEAYQSALKTCGNTSGESPEKSESTPAR